MKCDFFKQYCLLPFLQSNWTIKKHNCIPIIKSELVRLWRKPTCAVKQNIPSATTATYACMSPEPPQVLYASIPVLLWWRVSCKMKKNNNCFIGTSMWRISITLTRSWQPAIFFYFLCTSSSKRKHRNTKHFIWLKFDSPQGDERINNIPQLQSNLRHKAGRTVLKAMHYKANKVKHTVNLILLWTALKTK